MEQQVLAWITQYGYLAIFFLLVFGIVGLPVPDETLLTFTGYLVFTGTPLAAAGLRRGAGRQRLRHHHQLWLGRTFGHEADPPLRPLSAHHARSTSKGARLVRARRPLGPDVRLLHPRRAPLHRLCRGHERVWSRRSSRCSPTAARCSGSPRFIGLGYFLGERWKAVEENIHHYLLDRERSPGGYAGRGVPGMVEVAAGSERK